MRRATKEEFIEKAKKIFGEEFDYSKVEYQNNKKNIILKHNKCGKEFTVTPHNHLLRKSSCPYCRYKKVADKLSFTTEQFIEKAKQIHNNKYDYSMANYKNQETKIKIICKIHEIFEQVAGYHLGGSGCPKCAEEKNGLDKRLTTEQFIERANLVHNNKYDYSKTVYTVSHNKIEIICKKHGSFFQKAYYHLAGNGCPICRESKGEREIRKILTENNISFISQYKFKDCKDIKLLPFDFFLPELNILIEYQGIQHFIDKRFGGQKVELENIQKRDKIKRDFCKENNINLIEIKYDENIKNELLSKLF